MWKISRSLQSVSDWNRNHSPCQTDQWYFSGNLQRKPSQKWFLEWPSVIMSAYGIIYWMTEDYKTEKKNLHWHQTKDKMMETSVSTSILWPSPVPVVDKIESANILSPALFIFKRLCRLNVLFIQIFVNCKFTEHFHFHFHNASGTVLWLCQFVFDACIDQVLLIDCDMLID